jgi:effector-binding domain-containing protein
MYQNMRRSGVAMVVLPALLGATLFAGLKPYTFEKNIIIRAPIFEVTQRFTNLKMYKDWHSAFYGRRHLLVKYTDSSNYKIQQAIVNGCSYRLTILNAAAILLERTQGDRITTDFISAIPDSNGMFTSLRWVTKIKGFLWLKDKLLGQNNRFRELENLKLLMEDETKRYGYLIKIKPVVDTLILTKKTVAVPGKEREAVAQVYAQILQFLKDENLPAAKNYHYVSYTQTGSKQVNIAVGVPVNKKARKKEGYDFLTFPPNGRLLVGSFTGRYGGVKELYAAMDKYVMNNKLKKVAQQMEKHQNKYIGLADTSDDVSLEVVYPVY